MNTKEKLIVTKFLTENKEHKNQDDLLVAKAKERPRLERGWGRPGQNAKLSLIVKLLSETQTWWGFKHFPKNPSNLPNICLCLCLCYETCIQTALDLDSDLVSKKFVMFSYSLH